MPRSVLWCRSRRWLAFAHMLLAAKCQSPASPECEQVQRAAADFLSYWYFPKGSYWVYRQRGSSPAELDTVTVALASVRVMKPGSATYGNPICTELYEYTCLHSNRRHFRGTNSNNGYRGYETFHVREESGNWFVQQSSEAGNLVPLGFLWSSLPKTSGQPIANTGPLLLDTLPVTVPAGVFRRSAHLRIPLPYDSTRVDFLASYYLTRGVGYTRLTYANLGTWELLSYHLAS